MKYLFLKLRVTNNPQAVHGVDVGIPTLPGSRHQKGNPSYECSSKAARRHLYRSGGRRPLCPADWFAAEDVASFAKYLGGSSGNVAFGTAIQGLKSAMLARVGDEHNGRFLRETLNRAGVDTEYLITDKSRLTALVMLGIKDQETFP